MAWTKRSLQKIIKDIIGDRLLVIASNREPYIHLYREGKIEFIRPVGGAVTALDPVMRVCRGVWVAHGSGSADKEVVNKNDEVKVPPGSPRYTLKRIWLTKEEESGYYYGYSNRALWPLCHVTYTRPIFDQVEWAYYKIVNEKFADAILGIIKNRDAFVWIHDYHLTLLGKILKERNKNILTAHFLHIPWPNPEAFRICPQKKEILEGLLSNDLLGFHIRYHCGNFMETVRLELEARIDNERTSIIYGGHEVLIRAFPISVDFNEISHRAESREVKIAMKNLRDEFSLKKNVFLFVGLDRIDYTKGIIEKIQAMDRFFEKFPEFKEKVVFVQKGGLSRIHIDTYKELNEKINNIVEEVNWKHSTKTWSPIIFIRRHMTRDEIVALYRLADACIVAPLHDGMNLVAKEYVVAKNDLKGILLLSQFTGAARELVGATFINPYDLEGFAISLREVVEMPLKEKKEKTRNMRNIIKENNIYKWAGKFLQELKKI